MRRAESQTPGWVALSTASCPVTVTVDCPSMNTLFMAEFTGRCISMMTGCEIQKAATVAISQPTIAFHKCIRNASRCSPNVIVESSKRSLSVMPVGALGSLRGGKSGK